MPELRTHPMTEQRVLMLSDGPALGDIVAAIRAAVDTTARRADERDPECPFCRTDGGHEIFRLDASNAPPRCRPVASGDVPWFTRVLPETMPLLRVEGKVDPRAVGMVDVANAVGAHERIIESPLHAVSWHERSAEAIAAFLHTVAERIRDLKRDDRLSHFFPFRPAVRPESVEHVSLHLIATTVHAPPPKLLYEFRGASALYLRTERCPTCDILREEARRGSTIAQNVMVRAFLPYFSPSPFEVWVVPESHVAAIESLTPEEHALVAEGVAEALRSMRAVLGAFAFTVRIFTCPRAHPGIARWSAQSVCHLRLEIIPRLPHRIEYYDGFVEATGFRVNYAPPERIVPLLRGKR